MKSIYIFIVTVFALFTWACGHKDGEHNHEHGEERAEAHDHDHGHEEGEGDEIVMSPKQIKESALEIWTVAPGTFNHVIKTSGQVLSAQGDEVTVSATIGGIVSFNRASLNEGANVRGGESLLSISSKNLAEGDPILKAKMAYDIAKQEFDRAESLIGDKLISQKEYNEIKLNFENAKVTYNAFAKSSSSKGASVSSPIGGYIKSRFVSEGQYVDVGQPLFTVTQNRKMQLRADVSEKYYKDLGNIVSANFCTPYDNVIHRLSDLNGKVVSFGRSANGLENYVPINFEFDNIGEIVSGSYVEVYLLSQPKNNVISVPTESLVEDQGLFFVFLRIDDDCFKKQEVKIGASDGERVEVREGLKPGDKVVSKGAYHVRLASVAASIPHAHEH